MTEKTAVQPKEPILFPERQAAPAGFMEVQTARAAQEVQAAIVVAKRFPRDTLAAYNRIMEACKRKALADAGAYAYPRGGETVVGPSIRLAEVMAQNYGNLDFGIRQLSTSPQESVMEAFCWDLETNVRQTRVFTVAHERHTKKAVTPLTDPRDIYEMTANQGARRLRACILGIIPGDITDAAMEQCEATLRGDSEPLVDRLRAMIQAFHELGVSKDMLEKRLGHKAEAIIEQEFVNLKKIYRSLKDGMAKREDFFDLGGAERAAALDAAAAGKGAAPKAPEAPAAASEPSEFDKFDGGPLK